MSSIITALGTKALIAQNQLGTVLAADNVDPGVRLDYSAPWLGSLRSVVGMVGASVVVILVLGGFFSVACLVFGKFGQSGRAMSMGLWGLLFTLIGAALIGSLAGLIAWAAGLPLTPQ